MEDAVKALNAKDIDGVMSLYAPNLVSFDIVPPLRYAGIDNKRRAWQEALVAWSDPFAYEVYDLDVTARGELAFVRSLNHVSATPACGRTVDVWLRWTACFRRINGTWLIVHDHASVPADLVCGRQRSYGPARSAARSPRAGSPAVSSSERAGEYVARLNPAGWTPLATKPSPPAPRPGSIVPARET